MLAFFSPGPVELIVVGIIALLIFGSRLPSVMKNLGKGIVEFKRGVHGIEDEVDSATNKPAATTSSEPQAVNSPDNEKGDEAASSASSK